jgi:hypothetical protein
MRPRMDSEVAFAIGARRRRIIRASLLKKRWLISDKVEAAYQRGDMFDKRRRLMSEWAEFCARPIVAAEVVPIRAEIGA